MRKLIRKYSKLSLFRDYRILTLLLFLIIVFFFIYKVGEIPKGLFCDEAEIGNISFQSLRSSSSTYFVSPFFYKHFNYILGSLPIISTIPFVYFGLSEFTVRLSSVFYVLLGLFFVYLSLHELKAEKIYPLLLFAFTPLFFHISRINFGHAPSFMFISLGLFLLLKYRNNKKMIYLVISALSLGISSYGYGGYLLGSPIIVLSLLLGEILHNKISFYKYKEIIIFILIFIVTFLPILYQLKYNPSFLERLRDKNEKNNIELIQKIPRLIKNYPKYYSYDYLFSKGEIDLPNSFLTRHSIRGNGIYLKVYLVILFIGFFNLFFIKDKQKYYYTPFFILFLLSPMIDLITTKDDAPPYSFSIYYALISVPFITAYALKLIDYIPKKIISKRSFYLTITVILIQRIPRSFTSG